MATKRFPDDLTVKQNLHIYDAVLIGDSESSFQSKYTTIERLLAKASENLDITGKADVEDVLTISIPHDPWVPVDDYHPATKQYVDYRALKTDVLTIDIAHDPWTPVQDYHPTTKKYVDDGMALHILDLHALSGTHIIETAALSAAIDGVQDSLTIHIEDESNPHQVTQTQIGLSGYPWNPLDLPISTATQTALLDFSTQVAGITATFGPSLSADVVQLQTDVVSLSGAIDTLEVGAKVYTLTTSGAFTPDIGNYNHFDISINGDVVVGAPFSAVGQSGIIVFKQTGTSSDVTFSPGWVFPAGTPVINTSNGAANVFRYTVIDNMNILVEFIADWILFTP